MGSSPGIWLKLRIENFSTISRGLKPFSLSACNVLRISHTRQLQGKDLCKCPYTTLVAPGCTLSDYNSTPGISKTSPNLMQQKRGNLLFRCTLRATETLYMANDEALTGVSLEMHRAHGGYILSSVAHFHDMYTHAPECVHSSPQCLFLWTDSIRSHRGQSQSAWW